MSTAVSCLQSWLPAALFLHISPCSPLMLLAFSSHLWRNSHLTSVQTSNNPWNVLPPSPSFVATVVSRNLRFLRSAQDTPSVFLAEGKALLLLLCFSANSVCFILQYLLEEPPPVSISLALIYMINWIIEELLSFFLWHNLSQFTTVQLILQSCNPHP